MIKRITLLVAVVLILSVAAFGAPRMVLGELFTSTTCPPCTPANNYLDSYYPIVSDHFVLIRYHVWWPAPGDPFYETNTEQNTTRTHHYGVSGVPDIYIDGEDSYPSASYVPSLVSSHYAEDAPIIINIEFPVFGQARITIIPDDPFINLHGNLFAVITEDTIYYDAPNGETIFHQVMREMYPSDVGEPVYITYPDTLTFEYDYAIAADWNAAHCNMVAFVQGLDDVVYQAAVVPVAPRPDYAIYLQAQRKKELALPGDSIGFDIVVNNAGAMDDNYTIAISTDIPGDWSAQCYSDVLGHFTSTSLALPGPSHTDVTLNMSVGDTLAIGTVYFTVTSGETGDVDTLVFQVISGADVLLVNDSPRAGATDICKNVLDDMGISYGYWFSQDDGTISTTLPEIGFDKVLWFCGDDTMRAVEGDERDALFNYLSYDDGKLFIAGRGIGRLLGSDFAFYMNLLGASFGSLLMESSIEGTSFADGISSDITHSGSVESIEPVMGGSVFLRYGDAQGAGICHYRGTSRSAYLSFPFADIDDETAAESLLVRILDFLDTGADIAEPSLKTPSAISVGAPYPTPFNSSVSISVVVSRVGRGGQNESARSDFIDISGRIIESRNIVLTNGENTIRWTPDKSLSSGIYLIRIRTDDGDFIRRMILAR